MSPDCRRDRRPGSSVVGARESRPGAGTAHGGVRVVDARRHGYAERIVGPGTGLSRYGRDEA